MGSAAPGSCDCTGTVVGDSGPTDGVVVVTGALGCSTGLVADGSSGATGAATGKSGPFSGGLSCFDRSSNNASVDTVAITAKKTNKQPPTQASNICPLDTTRNL